MNIQKFNFAKSIRRCCAGWLQCGRTVHFLRSIFSPWSLRNLLFPLLVFSVAIPAIAKDLIAERMQWLDPTGLMTVQEVARERLEPAPEVVTWGYTSQALWLRLKVQSDGRQPVMLRVRPTLLDDVQLWESDASAAGGWRMRSTGDRQPFTSSDRSFSALGFVIYPSEGKDVYWLRVITTSTLLVHVEALPFAQSQRKDARWMLLHVLNLSVLCGILAWSIYAWWVDRLVLAGWFAAYQASNLIYVMLVMGFMAAIEPEGYAGLVDQITGFCVILTHMLGLWLNRQVLRAYGARPWALNLLSALTTVVALVLLAYFLGMSRWALSGNMSLIPITALIVAVISFTLQDQPPLLPSIGLLRKLALVLLVSLCLLIFPLKGWVQAAEWSLHVNLLHGLLASATMLFILRQHAQLLRSERQHQHREMQRLQAVVDVERQTTEDHRQFIDMLTHEIKTPLGIALISLGALKSDSNYAARIDRALKDINAVVDRTRLSDLAEHNRLIPRWAMCSLRERLYECTESSVAAHRLKVFVGNVPDVRTDSGLLAIVINNLLDNALKYSPAESMIDVRLEMQSHKVVLTVINSVDTLGQPDEQRLFSKYYRSTTAQSKSGSGLGLYLSAQLARLLGIELQYKPRAGHVEFSLCIPV